MSNKFDQNGDKMRFTDESCSIYNHKDRGLVIYLSNLSYKIEENRSKLLYFDVKTDEKR